MSVPDLYLRCESVLRPLLRVGPIVGGVALLVWRVRETRVPVSGKAILIPPLGMSTGFLMFLSPLTRIPWSWALAALGCGWAVLSWPLLRWSRLEARDGGTVHLKRSRSFLAILLGLLGIRLLLHDYIGHLVSPPQTASVFYLMAFGIIVRWRIGMYREYRRIVDGIGR